MCIIFACDKGKRPTDEQLQNSWASNSDGAGLAWTENGRVEICKGLMTYGMFMEAYKTVPEGSPLIIHMRIATSGGLGQGVTHPFPISTDLAVLHALDVECPMAVAHNGVLDTPTCNGLEISDTMSYIISELVPLSVVEHLTTSAVAKNRMKKTSRGSRLALLDSDGNMRLVGSGWEVVTNGVWASNGSWRHSRFYGFDAFDDYEWDFYHTRERYCVPTPLEIDEWTDRWFEDTSGHFPDDSCCDCPEVFSCAEYGPACFINHREEKENVLV